MALKLKSIRCYQSVLLDKKQETSFTNQSHGIGNKKPVKLEIITVGKTTDVIRVSSPTDCVDIPFSNVSGIYYYNDHDDKKAEHAKQEAKTAKENSNNAGKLNRVKKSK